MVGESGPGWKGVLSRVGSPCALSCGERLLPRDPEVESTGWKNILVFIHLSEMFVELTFISVFHFRSIWVFMQEFGDVFVP